MSAGAGQPRTERGLRTGTDVQILDAAAAVFTRLGYTRTTISDIAGEAGTTRPTVYSYFSSKEAIFQALAARVRDAFTDSQRVASGLSAAEVIAAADREYLKVYSENAEILVIMQHQALSDPDMKDLWSGMHSRTNRAHIRFMADLVGEGRARPAASLVSIAAAVNGMVMRFAQLVAENPGAFEDLAGDLVRLHLALVGIDPREEEVAPARPSPFASDE